MLTVCVSGAKVATLAGNFAKVGDRLTQGLGFHKRPRWAQRAMLMHTA